MRRRAANYRWQGKRVRSRRELRNGLGVMPAGTVFEVDHTRPKRLGLLALPCGGCGLRYHVSAVPPADVEEVP